MFIFACSKNVKTAFGLGLAVTFVMTITIPVNWLINEYLLKEGAYPGLDFQCGFSFLVFITFIATIAASVQSVEIMMEKFSPTLYANLGIFLPLIAVNCSILGGSLFMEQRSYGFAEADGIWFLFGHWVAIGHYGHGMQFRKS